MLSKLTIAGLHNYCLLNNEDLWSNLDLPEGLDKELLVAEILRQASEFSLIYPDLDFMKLQIGIWSKKWKHTFTKWYTVYNKEYEPLFNVDVKTTIEDEIEDNGLDVNHFGAARSTSDQRLDTATKTGVTNSNTQGTSNGRDSNLETRSKAAYDASTAQVVETNSGTSTTSLFTSGLSSLSNSEGSSLSTSELTSTSERTSESNSNSWEHSQTTDEWKRGNYGTTMSQELLLAEFNAWYWNLYQHIAEIFVSEYCICIYE